MITHSAATVLTAYFKAVGIFTDPSVNGVWPVFANTMPDLPAELGVVYNAPGFMDGREMPTGRTVEHPGFSVMLRTPKNTRADEKGADVNKYLDQIKNTLVVVSSKTYRLVAMRRTTPMLPLGQEEGGGRLLFSISGTLTYVEA